MTTRMPTDATLSPESLLNMEQVMRQAVRAGIKEVLADQEAIDAFWASAFAAMQKRASTETGRFVLSGVASGFRKALWIAALFIVVYSIGGLAGVKALWHSVWGQ